MAPPKESGTYLALTIRNLPPGTTKADVENHINQHSRTAQPVVGPVVRETNRNSLYTTVTLCQDKQNKGNSLRDQLDRTRLFPRRPTDPLIRSSEISVSDEFLGITTLAEHENAQFDLYFIHGLGGHAYKSWTFSDDGFPQMWPKDFLPRDIANHVGGPKLAGRFSTIGYLAHAISTNEATVTIEKAAEDLLARIRNDRAEGSNRPIYFACHSLGGIVTCQALIRALDCDDAEKDHYRDIFIQNDECLVKGVFFFGTPFEGSSFADLTHKIVRLLGGNGGLIESLKNKSGTLARIVSHFNQLRSNPSTEIYLMAAYETSPLFNRKFVTKPDSAISSFKAESLAINADHRNMIKFKNSDDQDYRLVMESIIRVIQRTLGATRFLSSQQEDNLESPSVGIKPISPSNRSQTFSTIRSVPPPYESLGGPSMSPPTSFPGQNYNGGYRPDSLTRSFSMLLRAQAANSTEEFKPNNPFHQGPSRPVAPVDPKNLIREARTGREATNEYSVLGGYDTVFLIDDTGSMLEQDCKDGRSRWDELIESLRYTVQIICGNDADGCDVHFLMDMDKDEDNISSGQRILELLTNEVHPCETGGGTYMGDPLYGILDPYVDSFEAWKKSRTQKSVNKVKRPKKLNLIVITDGAADDRESVELVIVSAAKRLDGLNAPKDQVGIQFLQIGKDEGAEKWLKTLDDDLKNKHSVRDMVDTQPWDSPAVISDSFKDTLLKILLGGISRKHDDD